MKKTILFRSVFAALLVIATCSCQKSADSNSFDNWIEDGHITITAKGGDLQSKTVLQSNGDVYWSPGDSISVFYGQYDLGKFTGLNTEPADITVFRSDDTFAFGSISGGKALKFMGINPYRHDNATDGSSLTVTVPSKQKAVQGTFEPGSFPSVARSEDLELSFYNVCGGLKFKVVNSGITKVTFKGNNNETLAGKVKVGLREDNTPEVVEALEAETEVILENDEGFVPGVWYYISLLPAKLTKGFTMELSNGIKCVTYTSDKSTEVKRSIFGVLSDVDEGLDFEVDWRTNGFVHKSLFLLLPPCAFSSGFASDYNYYITEAMEQSYGNIEAIQMFADGPAPTEGISSLMSLFKISSTPFMITDYREYFGGYKTPYSTYLSTPQLYGTTSGLGLKTYYEGDKLNIEASLYIKKADNYKIVIALVQDDSTYPVTCNGGKYMTIIKSNGIVRHILTNILGDPVDAVSDNVVLYRSYSKTISGETEKKNLRVVAYLLRPYGTREIISTGNYGTCYVDNTYSVLAGSEAQLPVKINIDSEIIDFDYGGTIEL